MKKLFWECQLYVFLYVRVSSAWTVGRILFMFRIQELIHHRSVNGEHENSSSKIRGTSWGPQIHNFDFLENCSKDLITISSEICGDRLHK
jgi:hypothetical protein